MMEHRMFTRSVDSLPAIVGFTEQVFDRERIDPALRTVIDLAIEELFTNMVKYSTESRADVRIQIGAIERGVEVTLTDYDVEGFDVTAGPDVDVRAPIEERTPGGLGLHLIRRLLDSIEYEYEAATRQSRITFRKTSPAPEGQPTPRGG